MAAGRKAAWGTVLVALSTSTARALMVSKDVTYVLGPQGVDECPSGSVMVPDAMACEAGAIALGHPYYFAYGYEWSNQYRPVGCFCYYREQNCFFNNHPDPITSNGEYSGTLPQVGFLCQNGATANAVATGDPHLQNVHGERFDLTKPGDHMLITIPRGKLADTALLRVAARAQFLGKGCSDIYFTNATIDGSWAEAKHAGGYSFVSGSGAHAAPQWLAFGPVGVKIVHGHTATGANYLNVYVRSLGRAGYPVGGLLGEDDHAEEAAPLAACAQIVNLKNRLGGHGATPSASLASASF